MPLARISLQQGTSPAHRNTIVQNVYEALRESFNVPEDDLFMVVDEYTAQNFHFGRSFMGFSRSEKLVIIQLTVADTRNTAQKKALFASIAARLHDHAGLRPDDVLVNLVEVKRENWSFGAGIAQYAIAGAA
jgi:4-oxalocrotonate tautomerase